MNDPINEMRYCMRDECRHTETVHKHHRFGNDCGICGKEICPEFQSSRFWNSIRKFFHNILLEKKY